jgi:hypothetical protein
MLAWWRPEAATTLFAFILVLTGLRLLTSAIG